MEHIDCIYVPYIYNREIRIFKESMKKAGLSLNICFFKGCNGNEIDGIKKKIKRLKWENIDWGEWKKEVNAIETIFPKVKGFMRIKKPGQWGHQETFLAIFKDALNKGYKKIMILEPDAKFCHNFKEKFERYKDAVKDSLLFYLGSSQQFWKMLSIKNNKYEAFCSDGTFGIVVDSDLFKDIIGLVERKYFPTDGFLWFIHQRYKGKGKCMIAYPNLVIANLGESTIMKKSDTYGKYKWEKESYYF